MGQPVHCTYYVYQSMKYFAIVCLVIISYWCYCSCILHTLHFDTCHFKIEVLTLFISIMSAGVNIRGRKQYNSTKHVCRGAIELTVIADGR